MKISVSVFCTGLIALMISTVCIPNPLAAQQDTTDPPGGSLDGVTILSATSARFQFRAHSKSSVHLRGDFNDWASDSTSLMQAASDGHTWWLEVEGIEAGAWQRYHFLVDDSLEVADPYSELLLDPWNDGYIPPERFAQMPAFPHEHAFWPVSAFRTIAPEFPWTDATFQKPAQDRLVIYELLVRDFDEGSSFREVIKRLDYLQWLGITAIELMPVSEFDGNMSWGYNPSQRFALDKQYGAAEDLKRLVDAAHARGIAIIADIVPNHSFGLDPMVRLHQAQDGTATWDNPWFNSASIHPYSLGYDFNHEDAWTREFWKRVLNYWVDEYHIDGFRIDLSKGLTQNYTLGDISAWNAYDQSRVNILFDYANHVWSNDPGTYMILEHLGDNAEEQVLANGGFMIWGIMHSQYKDAALGYPANFSWASHISRGYTYPNLVAYMESHDEERVAHEVALYGNDFNGYNPTDLATSMERMAMTHAFLLAIPGPKMMYQWGELGYDTSIQSCGDGTFSVDCRTNQKPHPWAEANDPDRRKLARTVAALCSLKRDQPVFSTGDFSLDVGGMGKRIHLFSPNQNAVLCGNFDVVGLDMAPGFPYAGTWYDHLSGASLEVNDVNASYFFAPGQWHLWLDTPLDTPDLTSPLALLSACNEPSAVNFGAAESCQFEVVLRLDASDIVAAGSVSSVGFYVAGSFQDWQSGDTPMTEVSDNIWEASVIAADGAMIEYKFLNGTLWDDAELVPSGCGQADEFGGFNRALIAGPATYSTDPVCFGGCASCGAVVEVTGCMDPTAHNFNANATESDSSCTHLLTFIVDVAALEAVGISTASMHIAGSFQGWNAGGSPMSDPVDGTCSITLPVPDGLAQWKFLLSGDWSGAESVPAACGVENGLGSFNRSATVSGSDLALSTVCFSGCSWCNVPTTSCAEDINEDGMVTVADILLLLGSFGVACP
jgi:1,4-alpha-glucan branching enzyme